MKNPRILLIGRGHLGTFLKERLKIPDDLFYIGELADLDVGKFSPDVVVNTAGKTDLGWCESNALETFRCNVTEPIRIWRDIKKLKDVLFINLSSGCIWDGPFDISNKPFEPMSPPNPACFYAWTKATCDSFLLQECTHHLLYILRPRQVYSPLMKGRNTIMKLRSYNKLIDTPNSMTSAETIAKTISLASENPNLFRGGRVSNVYDIGVTSPHKVGCILAKANLRSEPVLMTKDELDVTLKPKRVDVVVHDEWFEKFVNPPMVDDEIYRVARVMTSIQAVLDSLQAAKKLPPDKWLCSHYGEYYSPYYSFMYNLAVLIKPELSVELGVHRARGSASLARGFPNGKVIGVDPDVAVIPDEVYPHCPNYSHVATSSTVETAKETIRSRNKFIDILMFDTEHNYTQVINEFNYYKEFFKSGTIVLFDDSHAAENNVLKAFYELPMSWRMEADEIHSPCGFAIGII